MSDQKGLLFTAFEPSGDEHAAAVIAQIKKLRPDIPIWGTGGQHMEAAGAQIIEKTTGSAAAVGWGAFFQITDHLQRLRRLKQWLKEHPLMALVPVDSPAANWSICKTVRRIQPQAKIVHMVCPQIWAWASWRIHRLRRLTDHVLCLLPFEPQWLGNRGVDATFVGHPVFEAHAQSNGSSTSQDMPEAPIKLALLPGSRIAEIKANWPVMLQTFMNLKREHPQMQAVIAPIDQRAADCTRQIVEKKGCGQVLGESLHIREGQVDAVMDWADVVLVVSGTATLHVAVRRKPMIVVYNISWWTWNLLARYLVKTRTFSLPNLISEWQGNGRAITEFCPHFSAAEPITEVLNDLIKNPESRERQIQALGQVAEPFGGHHWGIEAAQQLLKVTDSAQQSLHAASRS